jgi:hypothetical protein
MDVLRFRTSSYRLSSLCPNREHILKANGGSGQWRKEIGPGPNFYSRLMLAFAPGQRLDPTAQAPRNPHQRLRTALRDVNGGRVGVPGRPEAGRALKSPGKDLLGLPGLE